MNNINSVTISGTITATGEMSGTVQITGEPVLDSVTVKSTGVSQTIVPEQGVDGYNEITVSPLDMETVTVKSNSSDTQIITPSQGKDGISSISVEPILLQTKNVTPGACAIVVTPDSAFDGLSSVTVGAAAGGDFVLDFSVSFQGVVQQQEFEGMRNLTGVTFKVNNSNLEIGKWGFRNCSGLKRVEVPCCKKVGNGAFVGVTGHDLYLGASEPFGFDVIPITTNVYDWGEPASIHVPPELVNTYKNDANYSVFANIIVGDYQWPY